MSKGSAPRPIPDRETYESEFERIFGKKDKDNVTAPDYQKASQSDNQAADQAA